MIYQGACHCGAIKVAFETGQAADRIQVRECQCSFCRRHGGKTVSDPDGRVEFRFAPGAAKRYRFGTGTGDFLICNGCGGYVGVVMQIGGELFGIVNVTGADMEALAGRAGEPMDYSAESVEARSARRRRIWSPAVVAETA